MNIIGTGLSGIVGTVVTSQLSSTYTFADLSLATQVDIRNRDQVFKRIRQSDALVVLHMAAKTDVDGCESDRESDLLKIKNQKLNIKNIKIKSLNWKDWVTVNSAFAVNVIGTLNIAEACKKFNKKLIYISTDFVFDGKNKDHSYTEDDEPNPLSYYAYTKFLGEQIVEKIVNEFLIIRFSYPYGVTSGEKKSFVEIISKMLKNNKSVYAPCDNIITPTYIPDIAAVIQYGIQQNITGIIHANGSQSLSSYDCLIAIADAFEYDKSLVKKSFHEEFYRNKAPRPQWGKTSNGRLVTIGFRPVPFEEGLGLMKQIL